MRLALDLDVTRVAEKLGIKAPKWKNWEAGHGISVPEALNVGSILGISLDYIYTGKEAAISKRFEEQLRRITRTQLEQDESKPTRGPQPKPRLKGEAAD